jgi:spore germination protein KA
VFNLSSKDRQKIIDDAVKGLNEELVDLSISKSLKENDDVLKQLFADVDILRVRYIENNNERSLKYFIAYCEGVTDAAVINENIIKPVMISHAAEPGVRNIDSLISGVLQIDEAQKIKDFASVVEAVSSGDTVLFAEGADEALILETKSFNQRAITEPESEKILSGPREGFTESLITNLSLLRRKVRTHELKMKFMTLGKRTKTKVSVCYMESIVNKKILGELYKRLNTIDIDAVLDTNYIMELIRDARVSPYRTIGYTERPDVVISKLLEGRIALLADGSPVAITLPYLFVENFQSSEDYYGSFYYTTFSRMLRMLGFFLTIIVPAAYVSIVAYHHEMLPTQLLINITAERTGAPLPASLEAFVMLILFDLLRETGARVPSNISQPLSIVGALVIGQAAVEAKFVAAAMVIIVAITGITNMLVPKLFAPVIILRLGLLLLASTFGLYGLFIGVCISTIHIINLRSFGVPQISLTGDLKAQEIKDTFIRAPWWRMRERPKFAWNKTRMKTGGKQ